MGVGSFLAVLVVDEFGNIVSEIPIDVCVSRNPTFAASISKFPVEGGSSITDHRRKEPVSYEIEGMVSAAPINLASVEGLGSVKQAAHDALLDLHDNGRPVMIIDEFKKYNSMVLTSLSMPRNNKTGLALDFSAKFEELVVVRTASAALPSALLKLLKAKKSRKKLTESEKNKKIRIEAAKQRFAGKAEPVSAKPTLAANSTTAAAKTPGP